MNSRNIYDEQQIKQKKSIVDIGLIKSSYFLEKIFDCMKRNKSLEIIKCNKKFQKKLNLNIKDYKEYSQIYTPIEIELETVDDKYGRFINISEEKKEYYHIYFDNSNEEIKRNYLNKHEKVKTIKIIIDYQVKSFKGLFAHCFCINSIFFKKFYRINIIDMSNMFEYCSPLKELNLSKFNTNNVNNMSLMFFGCSSLKELNLSNFNTNNVTDMSGMLSYCSSLEQLNLTNFNTNNLSDMSLMFSYCSSLRELNLFNFNTNNETDMREMFDGCSSLKELNLSNLNTNNVVDMSFMFSGCSSLEELNFPNFNTNNANDINDIFYKCSDKLKNKIKKQNKIITKE